MPALVGWSSDGAVLELIFFCYCRAAFSAAILPDVWPTRCMSFAMKRPTRKAALRGALEFIAAHPDGCTEAILAAENIPASILIELVRGGFVVARQEIFENEGGTTEVTRVWITKAGELALAANYQPPSCGRSKRPALYSPSPPRPRGPGVCLKG